MRNPAYYIVAVLFLVAFVTTFNYGGCGGGGGSSSDSSAPAPGDITHRGYGYGNGDTTPPVNCTISINEGAIATSSIAVTLTLYASDPESGVSYMRFKNETGDWSDWESYATSKEWTLSSGDDGTRTVYVEYKNGDGLISDPVSDTIILDTTPPEITVYSPISGYTYTVADTIQMSYAIYDNESGIEYEIANLPLNESNVTNTEQVDATTLRLGWNNLLIIAINGAWLYAEENVPFKVVVTIPALESLADRYYGTGQISDADVYASLISQLDDIETSINQGLTNTAVSQMTTLINYIKAQSGIYIDSDIAQLLVKYVGNYQVRTALPRETTLYLASEWASSPLLDPNDMVIHLSESSDVTTTLRGSMNVRLETTADPDIASITVLDSNITGTAITVNEIDFGILYFTQDPYNASVGTLDLNNGHADITVRQLLTSTYLTSPVSLETAFSGAIFPIGLIDLYLMGSGKIPDDTPQIGGSPYTAASSSSSEKGKLPSDSWGIRGTSVYVGQIAITKPGGSDITMKITDGGVITLTPVTSITITGVAITITVSQAPSTGIAISPSASAPSSTHYGKLILFDIASVFSPSLVITNTQVFTKTGTVKYGAGSPVPITPTVITEPNTVFPTPTHNIIVDFPGLSISEGVDSTMIDAIETTTYILRMQIWMKCPDTGEWVHIGDWEWTYTCTIHHDDEGRVIPGKTVISDWGWTWYPAF